MSALTQSAVPQSASAPAGETGPVAPQVNNAPLAPHTTSVPPEQGVAGGAQGATPAPVDPALVKQHEKEHKQLEKTLHKEEKQEEKQVKHALKATQAQAKAEKKATKAEAKARKHLDKLTSKETKYAKGLARAQQKHDKVIADLNKAKQDLEIKTSEHQRLVQERQPKQAALDNVQHAKADHDAARQARLSADGTAPVAAR
ncbi:hypothetical protein JCM10450v2_002540 [Rhodotorula kratochvilovae]